MTPYWSNIMVYLQGVTVLSDLGFQYKIPTTRVKYEMLSFVVKYSYLLGCFLLTRMPIIFFAKITKYSGAVKRQYQDI